MDLHLLIMDDTGLAARARAGPARAALRVTRSPRSVRVWRLRRPLRWLLSRLPRLLTLQLPPLLFWLLPLPLSLLLLL